MTELVRTYIERYVTGTWADISAYVVGDLVIDYLISSPDEDVRIASVGRMDMVMNNASGNFSPNSNFQRGTQIRVRTIYNDTSRTRFQGTIRTLYPDTLEWGNQYVRVNCVDWMQYAVDYPSVVLALQESKGADEDVAYLLSLMSIQPDNVTISPSRETFDFTFDNTRKATQVYTELSRLALSEHCYIYLRGGNTLVVESANTRKGTNILTKVPKVTNELHAILTDPNGGLILTTENGFAILADEAITPNLATGTIQPIDIELENGGALTNRVVAKTYPTRVDTIPTLLFQLDTTVSMAAFGTYAIRGNYADPDGGAPISGKDFQTPMITGTNYRATNKAGTIDTSTQLVITEHYGSQEFQHTVFNNGNSCVLQMFKIYGIGIYPYNTVETPVMSTGSANSYSISEMQFDQRYQDDVNAGIRYAEMIVDDEKNPRNRLMSATFDASMSSDLMQASQYLDTGDLTWIRNAKPAIDTYAYIRGKRVVISPAGQITETWYLKETDSLQKGLTPIALKFAFAVAKNGVNFGVCSATADLTQKTIAGWIRNEGASPNTFPPISRYDGTNGWYLFQMGSGSFHYRHNFTPTDGTWSTLTCPMTGSMNVWHHLALTYDSSSVNNDPSFYLDGVSLTVREEGTPVGTADTDADANVILGNLAYSGVDYFYSLNGQEKDFRIYDRILSQSEIVTLASNFNGYLLIPDGLVFQAPCVKDEDYAGLTGTILYPTNKLIDNIYGYRGTPNWSVPSGTGYGLKAYSPYA